MQTIRFEDKIEEGLRIIILNGTVEYTEYKGVYRVPNYVLELLEKEEIPFKFVNLNGYALH